MRTANPDIEVYVLNATHEDILAAVEGVVGPFVRNYDFPEDQFLYILDSRVLIISPAEDDFLSVYMRGDGHWSCDLELARYLSSELKKVVRCDPGSSFPDVSPYSNVFVEISEHEEILVEWG